MSLSPDLRYLRRGDGAPYADYSCKRCHARKRKCDRKYPQCSACVAANVPCVVEIKQRDKGYVLQINDLRSQNEALSRRIRWLEEIIAASDPKLAAISDIPTGESVNINSHNNQPVTQTQGVVLQTTEQAQDLLIGGASESENTSNLTHAITPSFLKLSQNLPSPATQNTCLIGHGNDTTTLSCEGSSRAISTTLPSLEQAINICKTFLNNHKQSHHIVDEDELMEDLQKVYQADGLTSKRLSRSRFRCFMILHLAQLQPSGAGSGTEEHHGSQSIGKYRLLALREAGESLGRDDLECVQALGLLALMSIQEPEGPDLWQLIGMAARTAVAIGIHRKDSVYLASLSHGYPDEKSLQRHNDRRKNIFWAIYSLDRLVTFTLCRPPALRDDDIDVEMLTLPTSSSTISIEVPGVAVRVHSLQGRKLYGQIHESLYGVHVTSDRPQEEREAMIAKYTQEVHAWYASSPLKAAFVPLTEATVRRQSLTDMQFHQMIVALHRPSPLMPRIPSSYVHTLHEAASISVDLYRHYSSRKEVLVNWIHLQQIFTSCTTLVYCFCEYRIREDLTELPDDQVTERINQCRELLNRFEPSTTRTLMYESMFDALASPLCQEIWQRQHQPQQQEQQQPPETQLSAFSQDFENLAYPDANLTSATDPNLNVRDFALGNEDFNEIWNQTRTMTSPTSVMMGFWADTTTVPDAACG